MGVHRKKFQHRTIRLAPLQLLLDCLELPESCAVLGAGASYPMVPLMRQLATTISDLVLGSGIFPAEPLRIDPVATGILGMRGPRWISPWDTTELIREELLQEHVSSGAIRAATVAALSPAPFIRIPPQYAVFGCARYRMGVINYNNDGLTSRYCRPHVVVDVHGTTPAAMDGAREDWVELVEIYQEFPSLPLSPIPGLHFPTPETLEMASWPAYAQIDRLLARAGRLAIIGYSFGEDYDWVSRRMVINTLQQDVPAVIVNPNAIEIAERLRDDAGRREVAGLPMRWDMLACAILATRSKSGGRACNHRRLCARCVDYTYHDFVDRDWPWDKLAKRFDLSPRVEG